MPRTGGIHPYMNAAEARRRNPNGWLFARDTERCRIAFTGYLGRLMPPRRFSLKPYR